jgi:hypothetical protein
MENPIVAGVTIWSRVDRLWHASGGRWTSSFECGKRIFGVLQTVGDDREPPPEDVRCARCDRALTKRSDPPTA